MSWRSTGPWRWCHWQASIDLLCSCLPTWPRWIWAPGRRLPVSRRWSRLILRTWSVDTCSPSWRRTGRSSWETCQNRSRPEPLCSRYSRRRVERANRYLLCWRTLTNTSSIEAPLPVWTPQSTWRKRAHLCTTASYESMNRNILVYGNSFLMMLKFILLACTNVHLRWRWRW